MIMGDLIMNLNLYPGSLLSTCLRCASARCYFCQFITMIELPGGLMCPVELV